MKSKQVWRYYCEFCGKASLRRHLTARHELHCYKNPDRTPYEGELSYIGLSGTTKDFGPDASIGCNWFEWTPFDPPPKWWPGEGKIFHDGQWHDVPGYKLVPAKPGHGCAGGACPEEEWPCIESCSLPSLPAKERFNQLFYSRLTGEI
jgi:hypothetical protein